MNTLRLENINLHAPYRVMQDPERHNNFYFVSDSDARFDIDFAENDSIIPSGAYPTLQRVLNYTSEKLLKSIRYHPPSAFIVPFFC